MSTNPKDLKAKDASEELIAKHKSSIDRSVRALMQSMEHENTLIAEPPISRLQRVLKIYRQIEPPRRSSAPSPSSPTTGARPC